MRERNVDDALQPPGLRGHQHAAVAEQQRLLDRVRHIDHGLAGLLPDARQLGLQDRAVLRVERRERLVHQQHRGIGHEGARDRAALAHAAGKLVRIVVAEFREPDELERAFDPHGDLARRNAARHQPEADIRLHVHPGEQPALLEHHRVLTAKPPASTVIVPPDLRVEAGKDAQQGGLAAAARADDADELARL